MTDIPDELNPDYLFQIIHTDLVCQIANRKLDVAKLAKKEMANRGLDQYGKWIGFEKAAKFWRIK